MTKSITAVVVIVGLLTLGLCAGCGKDDSAAGPPGPAVGSTTPQGGVITVAPQHGTRPHMAGGPGK